MNTDTASKSTADPDRTTDRVGVGRSKLLAEIIPFQRRSKRNSYQYKVHGFWHTEYVYVRADGSVNWSCSGRDEAEEPSDLVAVKCFALALDDALAVAENILANTPDQERKSPASDCLI
jgi:hypothetical protein